VQKTNLADHVPQFVEGVKAFAAEKGSRYDVIHSHYWMSALAAEPLSDAWGGVPIVQMFHTLGEMKNRIAQSDAEREQPERIAAEKRALARSHGRTLAE
jgi:D-inositol-3-phosphate glycosyltransferase